MFVNFPFFNFAPLIRLLLEPRLLGGLCVRLQLWQSTSLFWETLITSVLARIISGFEKAAATAKSHLWDGFPGSVSSGMLQPGGLTNVLMELKQWERVVTQAPPALSRLAFACFALNGAC